MLSKEFFIKFVLFLFLYSPWNKIYSEEDPIRKKLIQNFQEIYLKYKFPAVLTGDTISFIRSLSEERSEDEIAKEVQEYQDKEKKEIQNCKNEKVRLYLEFVWFIEEHGSLLRYCTENKMSADEIIKQLKVGIFIITRPIIFVPFFENEFASRKMKDSAKKLYDLALKILVHYANFRYNQAMRYDLRGRKLAESLNQLLYENKEESGKAQREAMENKYYDLANFENQLLYKQLDETQSNKKGKDFRKSNLKRLSSFQKSTQSILSIPAASIADKEKLKSTISCFESWPKEHFDYLSLDYYSGFYLDYGRKFEYKDHEKIDPEFSKVLDFYYKSLYQNEIFSMRLEDVLKNCQRLAKIPSMEFSYQKILEKYEHDKKTSTTSE